MDEHGEHSDLRGLGHQSVIPYVHGRMSCIAQVLAFFLVALSDLESSNAQCSLL
jgi:hypothetical protein